MSKSESASDSSTPGTDPTYIPSNETTSFIETSGGLLTEQTILSLRQERFDHPAAKPETFALPGEEPPTQNELEERIALIWEDLVERWDELTQKGRLFEMDISEARSKWILKLFQALDFEPVYQRSNIEVEGLSFDLSHKGWPDDEIADYGNMGGARAPILHTIEPESERDLDRENKLDRKPEGAGRGASSPHDTLQSFLNASKKHNWGIVTDGVTLRVLRDYYHTYTRGYVEFDLENIFTSRNYQDFRALYRLCHPSRFLPRNKDALDKPLEEVLKDDRDGTEEDEEAEISTPLEMLYQTSLSTGVKVGQDLQSNVISALETLGNGLLNPEIREFLREGGEEEAQEYYQELLMIIYRLLFLLYAEQRGMMPGRDSLYTDEYSVTKLRQRAEKRRSQADNNTDLWHGLQATFKLAEEGNKELGVPAYNGMLFDSEKLNLISESECANKALLSAISDLTLIEHDGVLQRISYADLGVEEVGSIYESLLEFTPRLAEEKLEIEGETVHSGDFYLDSRGMERKETGSYYTDPKLVQELIKSALEPVVNDRLAKADDTKEAQEAALLDIDVVDPACGSAAFLIAATNYLGRRLAEIREGMEYPLEDDVRDARRSVLQHCIYGVDLNPMAVELAKVSLWIDSAVKDKPLNFLDHHIKCGNSLLGTSSKLIENGLPHDAYETTQGREWYDGNGLRKRVRNENSERTQTILGEYAGGTKPEYIDVAKKINEVNELNSEDIREKQNLYRDLRDSDVFKREKLAYDVWTAAFFWPVTRSVNEFPTPKTIDRIRRGGANGESDFEEVISRTKRIAARQNFFHWELEFPAVYADGGFDCIIGNPPWETFEVKDKEFFAVEAPEIANSSTKSERKKLIEELEFENPELYQRYHTAVRDMDRTNRFVRESGRFPLTAVGHINTYGLFAEHAINNVNEEGYSGSIVPTGIATDSNMQDFFRRIIKNNSLVSLYDFQNTEGIFENVTTNYRFCLLTLAGEFVDIDEFELAFELTNVDQLNDVERKFDLSEDEIELINPNTKTCPVFRSRKDAELTIDIYEHSGALKQTTGSNSWDINIRRMFNMSDDSGEFVTRKQLISQGCQQDGNQFYDEESRFLPIYESKMMHQYDHRHASFEYVSDIDNGSPERLSVEEKNNPSQLAFPRYWMDSDTYENKEMGDWHIILRNIARATDEHTIIGTIIPNYPTVHSVNHIEGTNPEDGALLLACLNSFVLNYVAKQKISGMNISHYILRQLPVPTPDQFEEFDIGNESASEVVQNLVLQLIYTAEDLAEFAAEIGGAKKPYQFDGEERTRESIRFELEAILLHIYGVSESQIETVFDRFDQTKKNDIQKYGEYRTQNKILEKYRDLEDRVSGGRK
ncbi:MULTISPECIES: Eco57I restriction-modification methylase domain-containing protein [Haloferax]|uniref:site-specific DNA-methyltransferase (adenine-specific) n=1 Tax=Haloferax marinum TaxID=2666143 RepID=A0A6A8G8Y5_9EURY|nr:MULTISPECIES: N-6 DNA methylase [Haloferax]KAB1198128.1 N-6 DNA methylase [Haloferax sp. CBA1150]MRW97205.1 N-6 DNA methylase [Haloferax marinum]